MVRFNFDIPFKLHKQFKIRSIEEEKDMSQILIVLISKYVKKSKNESNN